MHPVEHVVEQLWAPALRCPDLRVVVDTPQDGTWCDVESYWLVPNASAARLLVAEAPRAATVGLLTNYRRMRSLPMNISRFALGAAARAGAPIAPSRVAVQVRRAAPEAAMRLPLALLSQALGQPLFAATGVRTSDNRKTTLHLVDAQGRAVGYAKFGWNSLTNSFVRNELRVLKRVGGQEGLVRTPGVVAELDYHGNAVLVTGPLPSDVRGRPTQLRPPSPAEMFALTPAQRLDRLSCTGQFSRLAARLRGATVDPVTRGLAEAALPLLQELEARAVPLPVAELWHGDMTSWNCARERDGQLWVWDWESSEDDAVAGLDAVHWAFGQQRLTAPDVDRMNLFHCLHQATPYLVAAGVPREGRAVVAAAYALTVTERAISMAGHARNWEDAFISPSGLRHLLDQGTRMLSEA